MANSPNRPIRHQPCRAAHERIRPGSSDDDAFRPRPPGGSAADHNAPPAGRSRRARTDPAARRRKPPPWDADMWELAARGSRALNLQELALPFMDDVLGDRTSTRRSRCWTTAACCTSSGSSLPDSRLNAAHIAQRMPVHAASSGLVLLAFSPLAVQEEVLAAPLAKSYPRDNHRSGADPEAPGGDPAARLCGHPGDRRHGVDRNRRAGLRFRQRDCCSPERDRSARRSRRSLHRPGTPDGRPRHFPRAEVDEPCTASVEAL